MKKLLIVLLFAVATITANAQVIGWNNNVVFSGAKFCFEALPSNGNPADPASVDICLVRLAANSAKFTSSDGSTAAAVTASSVNVGTAGTTAGSVVFSNATSGSVTLAPTTGALGTVTATLPATTGTVSLVRNSPCASASATCTETPTVGMKVINGISGALNGASPSVATVTFSTGFTSSSSYACTATPNGATAAIAAGGIAITYTSATVVTFTSANAAAGAVSFICVGS